MYRYVVYIHIGDSLLHATKEHLLHMFIRSTIGYRFRKAHGSGKMATMKIAGGGRGRREVDSDIRAYKSNRLVT